jgi:hypothetical protein
MGTRSGFLDLALGCDAASWQRLWGEVGSSSPAPFSQPPVSGWSPRPGWGEQLDRSE